MECKSVAGPYSLFILYFNVCFYANKDGLSPFVNNQLH